MNTTQTEMNNDTKGAPRKPWHVTPLAALPGRTIEACANISCVNMVSHGAYTFALLRCTQGCLFLFGGGLRGDGRWAADQLKKYGICRSKWQERTRKALVEVLIPEEMEELDTFWAVETAKAEAREKEVDGAREAAYQQAADDKGEHEMDETEDLMD